PRRCAVVGAGPAGLACASTLAERGHKVTLFDQNANIGGQFNMAKRIPGKEEFHETLRYYAYRLETLGVRLELGKAAVAEDLRDFDEVIVATGVRPREISIPGIEHPKVLGYAEVLRSDAPVGRRVAIIGAGGIGFDVAEFLVQPPPSPTTNVDRWREEWGVDRSMHNPGGLMPREVEPPAREVWLLQRSEGRPGRRLNKTSGWVHRATLKAKGVTMLGNVSYRSIDDAGLHVTVDGEDQVLPADNVVICAGQVSNSSLADTLAAAAIRHHVIGGADIAAELDAKRAIDQGTRLAAGI
ncbi:MAG: FAD-dependent oxidoreductase, partial [Rhodanobacteraceae bacterium]